MAPEVTMTTSTPRARSVWASAASAVTRPPKRAFEGLAARLSNRLIHSPAQRQRPRPVEAEPDVVTRAIVIEEGAHLKRLHGLVGAAHHQDRRRHLAPHPLRPAEHHRAH